MHPAIETLQSTNLFWAALEGRAGGNPTMEWLEEVRKGFGIGLQTERAAATLERALQGDCHIIIKFLVRNKCNMHTLQGKCLLNDIMNYLRRGKNLHLKTEAGYLDDYVNEKDACHRPDDHKEDMHNIVLDSMFRRLLRESWDLAADVEHFTDQLLRQAENPATEKPSPWFNQVLSCPLPGHRSIQKHNEMRNDHVAILLKSGHVLCIDDCIEFWGRWPVSTIPALHQLFEWGHDDVQKLESRDLPIMPDEWVDLATSIDVCGRWIPRLDCAQMIATWIERDEARFRNLPEVTSSMLFEVPPGTWGKMVQLTTLIWHASSAIHSPGYATWRAPLWEAQDVYRASVRTTLTPFLTRDTCTVILSYF